MNILQYPASKWSNVYKLVPREKEKQIFFGKRQSTRFNAVMVCANNNQIWTKSFEYW